MAASVHEIQSFHTESGFWTAVAAHRNFKENLEKLLENSMKNSFTAANIDLECCRSFSETSEKKN